MICIGVRVAPVPIIALLFIAALREFAVLFVPFSQVTPVSAIFAVIPAVVVAVILVVDPHASGATCKRQRRENSGCENAWPKQAKCLFHVAILLVV